MNLEHHLLAILESLHDAVLVTANDSTITYVNNGYTRNFNVPAHKLIGRKLTEIEPKAKMLEVLQTGEAQINIYSYVYSLRKDVCANITPLIENGKQIGAVMIMKDVSEIAALQEELSRYKNDSIRLEEQLDWNIFNLLKSKSVDMQRAVNLARKVARTEATVLLYGETGVGKEVFAKAIHRASERMNKPFIPINMSSIPATLFESEMFGFEEGAFTGSRRGGKKGLLELANGGTLFLDEIGEMPLDLQAKILRVIQERAYQKVGGTKWHPLDVRIICATHRDLGERIRLGHFREDLYYRLNVVPITIPPLRERKPDIPFLATNILTDLHSKYQKYVTVPEDVYDCLTRHHWPGNVRELVNVLERMTAVCSKTFFSQEDIPDYIRSERPDKEQLPPENHQSAPVEQDLTGILQKTEKEAIEEALKTSKNRTEAIRKLGISRKTFYARLQKYGFK